jgi:hypothetical protein
MRSQVHRTVIVAVAVESLSDMLMLMPSFAACVGPEKPAAAVVATGTLSEPELTAGVGAIATSTALTTAILKAIESVGTTAPALVLSGVASDNLRSGTGDHVAVRIGPDSRGVKRHSAGVISDAAVTGQGGVAGDAAVGQGQVAGIEHAAAGVTVHGGIHDGHGAAVIAYTAAADGGVAADRAVFQCQGASVVGDAAIAHGRGIAGNQAVDDGHEVAGD